MTMIERGGVKIAVIGQALPYTPIANPRWMIPELVVRHPRERPASATSRRRARTARSWWCCCRTTASTSTASSPAASSGIDVILTGAHPRRAARGGQGRQDAAGRVGQPRQVRVAARPRRARRRREGLSLQADPGVLRRHRARRRDGGEDRAPSARRTRRRSSEVVGRTETLLYRRGNFNGTFDDLICDALLAERDAEIALSPGFRWGAIAAARPARSPARTSTTPPRSPIRPPTA